MKQLIMLISKNNRILNIKRQFKIASRGHSFKTLLFTVGLIVAVLLFLPYTRNSISPLKNGSSHVVSYVGLPKKKLIQLFSKFIPTLYIHVEGLAVDP